MATNAVAGGKKWFVEMAHPPGKTRSMSVTACFEQLTEKLAHLYFLDFVRLSGLHSIWEFAEFVFPPLLHALGCGILSITFGSIVGNA